MFGIETNMREGLEQQSKAAHGAERNNSPQRNVMERGLVAESPARRDTPQTQLRYGLNLLAVFNFF